MGLARGVPEQGWAPSSIWGLVWISGVRTGEEKEDRPESQMLREGRDGQNETPVPQEAVHVPGPGLCILLCSSK